MDICTVANIVYWIGVVIIGVVVFFMIRDGVRGSKKIIKEDGVKVLIGVIVGSILIIAVALSCMIAFVWAYEVLKTCT